MVFTVYEILCGISMDSLLKDFISMEDKAGRLLIMIFCL